jgi:hypothetical protein
MAAKEDSQQTLSTENITSEEAFSFDALARGLVSDTLSRRQALKLVGGAVFSAVLGGTFLPGEALARRHRKRKKPDLVPVSINGLPGPPGFCASTPQTPLLAVRVKNQGKHSAGSSTTTVTFSPGGSVSKITPPIPAGGSVDLHFDVPGVCYDPDCDFTICVDSKNQVHESNETNNCVVGICIG